MSADPASAQPLPDQAAFTTARVVAGSRRSPLFLVGWIVVLGGAVSLGLSAKPAANGTRPPGAELAMGGGGAVRESDASPATLSRSSEPVIPPRFDPAFPDLADAPGLIHLDASRRVSTVFVQGDLYMQQVRSVLVTTAGPDGYITGQTWIDVPEPFGDGRDHGPPVHFDVEMPIPAGTARGTLVVQATVYGPSRVLIASTVLVLAPTTS